MESEQARGYFLCILGGLGEKAKNETDDREKLWFCLY